MLLKSVCRKGMTLTLSTWETHMEAFQPTWYLKNTWDKIEKPPSFSSQITNGIGWVLLMLAFIFLRKSAWKFLKREGLVSVFHQLYVKEQMSNHELNSQDSLLPNSDQNPLHRLIELFFTDTGDCKLILLWVWLFDLMGDNQVISG